MAASVREVGTRSSDNKNSSNSATDNFALIFTITSVFCIISASVVSQIESIEDEYKPIWVIKTLARVWAAFQVVLFSVVKFRRRGNAHQQRGGNASSGLFYKAKNSFLIELRNLILLMLLFIASCLVFHIISVLYGAYIFENVEETFIFSVLVSTLVSLPCLLVNELSQDAWNRTISGCTLSGVESYVVTVACCSLLGAWLGAIPIPLDWDRPWQVWPISCSIGVVIGHGSGLFICTAHAGFKQFQQYRRGKTKLF